MGKSPKMPKQKFEPVITEEEKKKSLKIRSALLATEGGITGQELTSEQIKKRDTLMGN
jgi:hypothetical protein